MKIAICGSMAFAKEMLDIKNALEKSGHFVTVPTNTDLYARKEIKVEDKWKKIKLDVIKKYFEKIKENDAVLIINKDKNGIKNYVGGNSLIEIAFAHVLDKKIFLLNEVPEMNYKDEILAMKPIIIHTDINKIK